MIKRTVRTAEKIDPTIDKIYKEREPHHQGYNDCREELTSHGAYCGAIINGVQRSLVFDTAMKLNKKIFNKRLKKDGGYSLSFHPELLMGYFPQTFVLMAFWKAIENGNVLTWETFERSPFAMNSTFDFTEEQKLKVVQIIKSKKWFPAVLHKEVQMRHRTDEGSIWHYSTNAHFLTANQAYSIHILKEKGDKSKVVPRRLYG